MLTKELKNELLNFGYLREVIHSSGELFLYNYTQLAQFDKEAFIKYPILKSCRGLILDRKGSIIARGIDKFWNYEEYSKDSCIGELPPYNSFEITDKVDGSLIIVFEYKGEMIVCTRGSFTSDQAYMAKEILETKHSKFVEALKRGRIEHETRDTFLFELVGKRNKIVVDYAEDELVALTIIALNYPEKNYFEYSYNWLRDNFCPYYKFKLVDNFNFIGDFTQCRELLKRDNAEGFVVKFDNGLRVKLKYEEYVRLHKVLTNVTNKTIWEMLKNKDDFSLLIEKVPDEFFVFVKRKRQELEKQFYEIYKHVGCIYEKVKNLPTRKEIAKELLTNYKDYASIIFAILDGKPYYSMIWDKIKPSQIEKPTRILEE